jgi:hypothetical protein
MVKDERILTEKKYVNWEDLSQRCSVSSLPRGHQQKKFFATPGSKTLSNISVSYLYIRLAPAFYTKSPIDARVL